MVVCQWVCVAVLRMRNVYHDITLCQVVNSYRLFGEKACNLFDSDAGGTRLLTTLVTVYQ
jgi:hypothetical protein